MSPLIPALLAAALAAPAAAEGLPKIKFVKSGRSGVDAGDPGRAVSLLALQCARIRGRGPSEPCTEAELAGLSESDNRALRDAGEKYAHLKACEPAAFSPASDPDTGDSWIGEICGGAKYEIMTYEGRKTDPKSNSGLIRFMRESVLADCALYNAAVVFYAGLKEYDLQNRPVPFEASGASIEGTAGVNLAVRAGQAVRETLGREDPYLAMKVVALYGHDNKFNFLSVGGGDSGRSCQLKVLDAMKPNANSALYKDEAIGSPIGDSWKDAYRRLYDECKDAAVRRNAEGRETGRWLAEHELCGEYARAQTGYYHLNAAAYLQCACRARGRGLAAAAFNDLTEAWQRDAYMGKIAEYKVNAIDKVIQAALKGGHTPALRLLSYGFPAEFKDGMKPAEVDALPWESWCADPARFAPGTCGPDHVRFAKAAMKLFVFEVSYRVHLHHLGILAGDAYCRSGASLSHPRCGG